MMRILVLIVLFAAGFSFINNTLYSLDNLQELTGSTDIAVFYQTVDVEVKTEDHYLGMILDYIIYFIFNINIKDIFSIIETYNYV